MARFAALRPKVQNRAGTDEKVQKRGTDKPAQDDGRHRVKDFLARLACRSASGINAIPAHRAVMSIGASRSLPARSIIFGVKNSPSCRTRCM